MSTDLFSNGETQSMEEELGVNLALEEASKIKEATNREIIVMK